MQRPRIQPDARFAADFRAGPSKQTERHACLGPKRVRPSRRAGDQSRWAKLLVAIWEAARDLRRGPRVGTPLEIAGLGHPTNCDQGTIIGGRSLLKSRGSAPM
jgi:hypothetical protein